LLLPDFFTKEELDPCRKTTETLVDDLAKKLFEAGKIKCKTLVNLPSQLSVWYSHPISS